MRGGMDMKNTVKFEFNTLKPVPSGMVLIVVNEK